MAHIKQSAKRNRQNLKARERNKAQRTAMKTAIRQVVRAESRDDAQARLPAAMRRIDKAAKSRVIHRNAAARLKSRMVKKLQSAAG